MLKKLCIIAALATSLSLQANTITVGNSTVPNVPSGGNFLWTYTLNFNNSLLDGQNGHQTWFTIVDFGPVVGGTWMGIGMPTPANWSIDTSQFALGDPGIADVVMNYVGPQQLLGGNDSLFQLLSPYSAQNPNSAYNSRDYSLSQFNLDGTYTTSGAFGALTTPAIPRVPDGGLTLALIGLGLSAVEGLRRKFAK